MKKYVMPVTEIVTVEMPKLLGGSMGAGLEAPVDRTDDPDETNVFATTKGADVQIW